MVSNGEMTSGMAFGLLLHGRVGDFEGFRKKVQSVGAKGAIVQFNDGFAPSPAEVAPIENTMRSVPSWQDRRNQSLSAKAALIAKASK